MKALKFLRNSAGISMVEVMMAVSVVGGLSLTVAQLMKNTSESTKQNAAKQENVNLKGLVQNNLSVPQACKNTFNALITQANLTAMTGTGTVAVPNIRNKVGTGTIMYSSTTNLDPLTITTMVLTNYVAAAGTADLVINSTFKKSTNNIVMVKPIKIPINFNIDNTVPASPVLVNCSSMAVSGGEWMLGGNAGTVDGTDYLGTSDNQPLNFKVNNQKAGRIDSSGRLLAYGYQAASTASLSYISGATAFGHKALFSSLNNDFNTAIGFEALYTSTTGQANTAVGVSALRSNNQGASTALGAWTLMANTTGMSNVAIGTSALSQNILGSGNTAVGTTSLVRNLGSNNVALGYAAGNFNSSGSFNTYIGNAAGSQHGAGSYNTFIGAPANFKTSGSNNILIGPQAGVGSYGASNTLAIEAGGWSSKPLIGGSFAAPRNLEIGGDLRVRGYYSNAYDLNIGDTSANQANIRYYSHIGVPPGPIKYLEFNLTGAPSVFVATAQGNVAFGGWPGGYTGRMSFFPATGVAYKDGGGSWTATSDRRLKKNIKNLDDALSRILKLRPVTFEWRLAEREKDLSSKTGFIAQEMEKVFPEWIGELPNKGQEGKLTDGKVKHINLPIGFDAYLVKAIQEMNEQVIKNQEMFQVMHLGLEEQVKALEEEVKDLKLENKQLRDRLNRIEKALNIK